MSGANPWTVITVDPGTGEVLVDWVEAADEWGAFASVRRGRDDMAELLDLICAVPGHVEVFRPTETGAMCALVDYPHDEEVPSWLG